MTGALTHRKRWQLVAALFAALMLLGACGGDDGDSAEGGNGDSVSADEDGDSSGNGGGSDGPSLGDILSDSECAEFAAAMQGLDDEDFANFDDLGDLADQFDAAADSAPSEIRDDMRLVADAFGSFAQALADMGVNFNDPASFFNLTPDQIAQLEEASEKFDTPALEAAGDRVEAFIENNCT